MCCCDSCLPWSVLIAGGVDTSCASTVDRLRAGVCFHGMVVASGDFTKPQSSLKSNVRFQSTYTGISLKERCLRFSVPPPKGDAVFICSGQRISKSGPGNLRQQLETD